jgi:L-cysteine:1D-myo-inositol 2-amino-2-deoxy-alpha-D-glucopyranoside ligase
MWFIENITDIDDPLLERAKRDKVDWQLLAHSQIDLFTEDMSALRVLPPQRYKGVIESMSDIIDIVDEHIKSGLAYDVDGDLYLDLRKIPWSLERLPYSLDDALGIFRERGGDPERKGKRHPLDPLLWRKQREGEPSWNAPFGEGRPGWHVECVAIAMKNLDQNFTDTTSTIVLQGGGSDLIFPHHFMTAVQAESLTHRPFAKAYVHAGMIGLNGEKMSKSRGNLVFVSKLLKSGVSPLVIRTALIMDHYQSDRMWTDSTLGVAHDFVERMERCLARTEVAPTSEIVTHMIHALADNLDTPKVFASLTRWCDETESGNTGGAPGELSRAIDTYLGLAF